MILSNLSLSQTFTSGMTYSPQNYRECSSLPKDESSINSIAESSLNNSHVDNNYHIILVCEHFLFGFHLDDFCMIIINLKCLFHLFPIFLSYLTLKDRVFFLVELKARDLTLRVDVSRCTIKLANIYIYNNYVYPNYFFNFFFHHVLLLCQNAL